MGYIDGVGGGEFCPGHVTGSTCGVSVHVWKFRNENFLTCSGVNFSLLLRVYENRNLTLFACFRVRINLKALG